MRNNQILAVWGSPASGKTVTSVKLARELSQRRKNTILLFCDPFVPMIPVILPQLSTEEKSLGKLLSDSELTQNKILSNCLILKKNLYLGLLGYKMGDNVFTYADYTKDKAVDLLIQLRHIADFVILDCTSYISADSLSAIALEYADVVLRLSSCNLKGVSYFSSQLPILADGKFHADNHIKVLSNIKPCEPRNEIRECYKGVAYEIPNVLEIEQQYITGGLFDGLVSKEGRKYEESIRVILKEVFGE